MVRQPTGGYVSTNTINMTVITLATFAFAPLTVPGILLGYGGSVSAGGTYAIITTGLTGNLGLFATGALGTLATLNPSLKKTKFAQFKKPCSEGK